jgi:apolipoprotein N-acyltransferase
LSGERISRARTFWLAVFAGVALPLALAPFDWWPLSLVSAAVLFRVLDDARPTRAAFLGWGFGVGKYGVGASWIYVSIHDYGPAPAWLAGSLVALFVVTMALFPALFTYVYARWLRGPNRYLNAVAFSAAWVALEWTLTWFLTGFPWLYLGYAQLADPLRHWAPVGGVLTVSFVAALSATVAVAGITRDATPRSISIGVGVAAIPWLAGFALGTVAWVTPGASGTVALVQGDIPQESKWHPETVAPILDTYRTLTTPVWDHDLIIWPEAAVTLFEREATPFLEEMAGRANATGAALVFGIPGYDIAPDGEPVFRNMAAVIGNGSGHYVKRRLVPFGEYVPLEGWLRGLIEFFDLPMSHAGSGPERQPLLKAGRWRLATAICYEIVYPDMVRRDARDADVIVTISNDTWFGRSIGPLQHLQMAQMRAVENGRYVLRATNNGVTAIIASNGAVVAQAPQFEPFVLTGTFTGMTGATPYAKTGDTPLVALVGILLAATAFVRTGKVRR